MQPNPAARAEEGGLHARTGNDAAIAAALGDQEAGDVETQARESASDDGVLVDVVPPPQPSLTPKRPADVLQDSLTAIKMGSLRVASIIKTKASPRDREATPAGAEAATPAPPAPDAPPAQQQPPAAGGAAPPLGTALDKIASAAAELGAKAKEQGSSFYAASLRTAAATAEGLRRMAVGEPLQGLVRAEASAKPTPQLVLACCSFLAGSGLTDACLFQHEPPPELVERLAATMGSRAKLIQPGTSPHAVASLLKRFLMGLPEPLLTYRLLPQWVAAADDPSSAWRGLVAQLPPANANSLRLLLQLCYHINDKAAATEMDAQALAEALAPCLAWKPPPKVVPPASGGGGATAAPASPAPAPWHGLTKVLSRGRSSPAPHAVTAEVEEPSAEAAAAAAVATGGDAGGEAAAAAAAAARVTPLDEAEAEAIVTVLCFLITHFANLFG